MNNSRIRRFLWSRLAKRLVAQVARNEPRPEGAVSPDISQKLVGQPVLPAASVLLNERPRTRSRIESVQREPRMLRQNLVHAFARPAFRESAQP
jgi:hypothetical protein